MPHIVQHLAAAPKGRFLAAIAAVFMCAAHASAAETQWTFRNHVQPVLAKFGCSSGACHGAAAGKNGLKLSLRGYDDDGDYRVITRHALGRRVDVQNPGNSLLLLKPSGGVPHKGGTKFEPDSLEYRILAEWIAAGAPGPRNDDPRIHRIEIVPPHATLKPGDTLPVKVLAHFSDGTTQDVTRWTKYTAVNTSVADVDDATGLVTVKGNGEGAITAWYLSKIAIASVTAPYDNPPEAAAHAERNNFVDDMVQEKLRELRLPSSPLCDDATFIRRAFLDTIGVLPTAAETRGFLADTSAGKRSSLTESLLHRPEFVDYWSYKWSDLLLVSSRKLKPAAMWSYYNWVRQNVAANTPWDQFARQVVTARGSTLDNGAANFFVLHDNPQEASENISQAFLGMSIQCAKCHNHPMEKWTNDQYYGMANLLARVRFKNAGGADGNQIVFAAEEGDLIQPLTGKPQAPRPLDGKALPMDDPSDRREPLADWLVSPSNPYFARAVTNRVWASFMGRGLVEAVDDMRETNPPSNEKLLAALADHLVKHKFDLKSLMRVILESATYQRSGQPLPGNRTDGQFYARYYPKRLMGEAALDALSQVTGVPTNFKNFPEGWRSMQLPDSQVESSFLASFGRPERVITCECERTITPSVAQVLQMSNGDTITAKLTAPSNIIDRLIKTGDDQDALDELYLAAVSRFPRGDERSKILALLKDAGKDRRAALEDVCWSLLSSKEFFFNH